MDLTDPRNAWPEGVQPVFVHQGRASDGDAFFEQRAPDVRTVADRHGILAQGFGLDRGSLSQLFGAAVWKRGLQALRRGHVIGRPVGDVRLMPGTFLMDGPEMLWSHRGAHAGDHVGWRELSVALAEHVPARDAVRR